MPEQQSTYVVERAGYREGSDFEVHHWVVVAAVEAEWSREAIERTIEDQQQPGHYRVIRRGSGGHSSLMEYDVTSRVQWDIEECVREVPS